MVGSARDALLRKLRDMKTKERIESKLDNLDLISASASEDA